MKGLYKYVDKEQRRAKYLRTKERIEQGLTAPHKTTKEQNHKYYTAYKERVKAGILPPRMLTEEQKQQRKLENREKQITRQKEKLSSYTEEEWTIYWKNRNYKKEYGLTLDDWNKMFEEQNGCCFICGRHQSEFKRVLHVDHDHETGKVRSLLCSNCNVALATSKESIDILLKLIDYIKKFKS